MTISRHTQTSAPNRRGDQRIPAGPSKTKFSKTKTDIYQTVTDIIMSALEADVKPWSCPWQRVPGMSGLPSNYATGAVYSGINIMLLWCSVKTGIQRFTLDDLQTGASGRRAGTQGRTWHYRQFLRYGPA